jgi:hypothetical protein
MDGEGVWLVAGPFIIRSRLNVRPIPSHLTLTDYKINVMGKLFRVILIVSGDGKFTVITVGNADLKNQSVVGARGNAADPGPADQRVAKDFSIN